MTGRVFNIQRFSIHDGPGVRTTVFLKGCPASCWWCHNPESRSRERDVLLDPSRCLSCGACVDACPEGAAYLEQGTPGVDLELCTRCGICVPECPPAARQIIGRDLDVEQLLREVGRDRVFYEQSCGGVTFSGGEPMSQREFLLACLDGCRARGLHVAVDTCGAVSADTLLEVAARTDLFLYDLKLMDDVRHRRYVGISNARVLANLELLAREGSQVWVRVPVIPGVNDDAENLEAVARFVSALPRSYPVYLLPYHGLGADKYRRHGEPYRLGEVQPPSAPAMQAIARGFREHDLEVRLGA